MRDLGAGPAALGVVVGVFPFTALAGRLLSGRSTDRRGRAWTLRVGLAGAAGTGVLLVLPLPVPGLVAARALHGVADAFVYTAASAWVLDRAPVDERPQALALLGGGIWTGYALGPLVGAPLDLRGVGVVVVVTALACLALTAGLPDLVPGPSPHTGVRALLPRGVAVPGVALGLGNLGYAAVIGHLVLQVDGQGGRGALALTAFSVAVLAGRLVVVPLAVRAGILRTLPVGLVAMAAGLVALTVVEGTGPAAVAAAVIGLGYCLPFPALAGLVAGRVGAEQRGAAVGALTAFYDVFVGVGALVFGLVADAVSVDAVFLLAAAGVLAAAATNAGLARSEHRAEVLADATPDA